MKTLLVLAALFLPGSLAKGAGPENLSLRLHVNVVGKADYKGGDTKTQTRSLEIALENTGKTASKELVIQWRLYGHKMATRDLVDIKSGNIKRSLPAESKIQVSTETVKITGTGEHSVSKRKGHGRNARTTSRKVPASGHEYYGYSVRVYDQGKLVASEFSQPSLEKLDGPPK